MSVPLVKGDRVGTGLWARGYRACDMLYMCVLRTTMCVRVW